MEIDGSPTVFRLQDSPLRSSLSRKESKKPGNIAGLPDSIVRPLPAETISNCVAGK
jgi:hypothetical protein